MARITSQRADARTLHLLMPVGEFEALLAALRVWRERCARRYNPLHYLERVDYHAQLTQQRQAHEAMLADLVVEVDE